MRYFPRVLAYLKPYWKSAVLSSIIILFVGLMSLLAPWPMKIIVDHVLDHQPMPPFLAGIFGSIADNRVTLMIVVVLAGLAVTLLGDLFGIIESYVNTKLELSMARDFRSDLFLHAQRLSLAYHDHRRSGMMIYAINYQGDAVPGVIMVVPGMAQSLITLVGMFWITFSMDRMLALLSLTVVPFMYYSVGFYVKHIQQRLMDVKMIEGETLSVVHEAMSMLRVIVAFGREGHEHDRFRKQSLKAVNARVQLTCGRLSSASPWE